MSNILITNQAQFQPFSYQELVAPVAHQQQVLDELAAQYDQLSQQADVLEVLGRSDLDKQSQSYNRYKSYSDSLREEADNLYRNGLNSQSRYRLSELRKKYNTEIVPIQNAYERRRQQALAQQEFKVKNPYIRFTRDAANTKIEDYVANPDLDYGAVDMKSIAQDMSEAAKNLSKQIRNGVKIEGIDEYTNRVISQYGLDPNLINEWIQNPNASPILTNMLNQILAAHGMNSPEFASSPNGASILREAIGAAQRGAWSAVGEDREQMMENYANRLIAKSRAEALKNGDQNSEMPNWGEEHYGIKTSKGYDTQAREKIEALKGGKDGLKAGYFGKIAGQVNPMAIYEELQEEKKKHTKKGTISADTYNPYGTPYKRSIDNVSVPDEAAARKSILQKYAKYGVTDILSDDQYELLKTMGYNKTSNFGTRFSDIDKNLDKLATQYTRYSVRMAGYDFVNNDVNTHIMRMSDDQFKNGIMWELKEDGSVGGPLKDKSTLNLKTSENKDGNEITDIQYDPQHKGKILISFTDGTRVIASPDVIDAQLTRGITNLERQGYDPRAITAWIGQQLNTYNKIQGKTDSKI